MIRQAKSAYGKFWSKKQLQSFALLCVHCWAIFLRTLALAFRSAAIQKIMKDCISQNCPKQKKQNCPAAYVNIRAFSRLFTRQKRCIAKAETWQKGGTSTLIASNTKMNKTTRMVFFFILLQHHARTRAKRERRRKPPSRAGRIEGHPLQRIDRDETQSVRAGHTRTAAARAEHGLAWTTRAGPRIKDRRRKSYCRSPPSGWLLSAAQPHTRM